MKRYRTPASRTVFVNLRHVTAVSEADNGVTQIHVIGGEVFHVVEISHIVVSDVERANR